MRILLVAINAKFIHTSLAVRSLQKYVEPLSADVLVGEYTINNQQDFILGDIYEKKPDVLCFSCYLWNIAMVHSLARNLKKILPDVQILLGGPEVSYDGAEVLAGNEAVDLVMCGEGEATFFEVVEKLLAGSALMGILGTVSRKDGQIVTAAKRPPVCLDDLPFVYDDLSEFSNRICYYETQRGCPYSCQYCLSSVEQGVRFLSQERACRDLQFFLDGNVRQVKFVDRTFNANKAHAFGIWQYLIEHDNGYTNFHMEITADILDEASVKLLKQARLGLFQFEIGVQTTNEKTMEAIKRKVNFQKLSNVVCSIKALGNIHQHLDLIAGLPYEDYNSFRKSFNDVYALQPEQLQLGFLKLLKGAGLRADAKKYSIMYRDEPAYEVLATDALSYGDIRRLKRVEELVELYYNSGKMPRSVAVAVELFPTPFDFFESFGNYWDSLGYFNVLHNKMELYTMFYEFAKENPLLCKHILHIQNTLKFDLFLNDNVKTLPLWLEEKLWEKDKRWALYNDEKQVTAISSTLEGRTPKQISKTCQLVFFDTAVLEPIISNTSCSTAILFDYSNRDKFFGHAAYFEVN